MKNTSKFIIELGATVVVAGILSTIFAVLLAFIAGITGMYNAAVVSINAASWLLFGLMVGYRLNTLLRQHKP